jgi:hypothetical protein
MSYWRQPPRTFSFKPEAAIARFRAGLSGKIFAAEKGRNRLLSSSWPGLAPAIHAFERTRNKMWIRGTSPRKTALECLGRSLNRHRLKPGFPRTALRFRGNDEKDGYLSFA